VCTCVYVTSTPQQQPQMQQQQYTNLQQPQVSVCVCVRECISRLRIPFVAVSNILYCLRISRRHTHTHTHMLCTRSSSRKLWCSSSRKLWCSSSSPRTKCTSTRTSSADSSTPKATRCVCVCVCVYLYMRASVFWGVYNDVYTVPHMSCTSGRSTPMAPFWSLHTRCSGARPRKCTKLGCPTCTWWAECLAT
jgi:hypothetical protein